MSKFTPGPYVVVDGDTYIGVGMGSHTKNPSAYKSKHLWYCNLQHDDDEALATAKLMADAPALLEALQTLLIAMEDLQFDYNTNSGSEAMSQARALIAKHGGAV